MRLICLKTIHWTIFIFFYIVWFKNWPCDWTNYISNDWTSMNSRLSLNI